MPKLPYPLVVITMLALSSCHKNTPPTPPPVPVSVIEIAAQDIPADFRYIGIIESSHIVQLRARVEGYLDTIAYQEGSQVQEGDLLFVIDPRPFQAALDEAKALHQKQKALLWNAQQKVARYRPLYAENAISLKDLDDALSQELAMEAEVAAAQANVDTAALNLSFTHITAPVTAMSDQAKFRQGALISPGPDSLLTNLYVLDPIWINFNISQSDLLKAHAEVAEKRLVYPPDMNFEIEVVMADGSRYPSRGRVGFTDPALQQSTGTMLVRAVIPNPDKLLLPGGFAQVIVKGAVRPQAIHVPKTAVQQGQNGPFVFLLQGDKVSMQQVELGDWYHDDWIVTKGLKTGDIVVYSGVNRLRQASVVHVANKTTQAADRR